MLAKKVSPHLAKLAKKSKAVKKQFYFSSQEKDSSEENGEPPSCSSFLDPLLEEQFEKTKGLIHKYSNRVLILLTLNCAAYCRFCTRRHKVSEIKKGQISKKDIDKMLAYVKKNKEIKEIIFSGGDPLTVPDTLKYALEKFSLLKQIKIIRIGTRAPVSSPKLVIKSLLDAIKKVKQTVYVGIHFEHPAEITKETVNACVKLRQAGAILFSQSVFLRGVNNNLEILYKLFSRLVEIGVKPYYIYRCDPVKGAEHFVVPFEKEVKIMTELRKRLSGLAWPTYVIDTPCGSGKIPVPLDFWNFNKTNFKDFLDKKKKIV